MPIGPLRLAGLLLLILAVAHVFFARRLRWGAHVEALPTSTRQIFWVHTIFVVLVVSEQGLLLAVRPDLLTARSPLAATLCGGLAFFWGLRLSIQWAAFDHGLWKGRCLETGAHWAFTVLWAYLTLVFGWGFARQLAP